MATPLHPNDFDDTFQSLQRLATSLNQSAQASEGCIRDLRSLLTIKPDDLLGYIGVPQMAAIFAVRHGAAGIELLAEAARTAQSPGLRRHALAALWAVTRGEELPFYAPGRMDQPEVSDAARQAASNILDDLIVESASEPDLFTACLMMAEDAGNPLGFAARFMRVSSEASIRLTKALLEEFAELVDRNGAEAEYQEFLERNPVLLDPLAAEVYPLAPLGLEFKTDFVIRRHDDRYIVVEIERPQDAIFTAQVDFTARMTHAVGQVMDFQQWVSDNVAYARNNFPGIFEPAGLLVMGRSASLDARARRKLARWQVNSRHIELSTYDGLLARGWALLHSLRH